MAPARTLPLVVVALMLVLPLGATATPALVPAAPTPVRGFVPTVVHQAPQHHGSPIDPLLAQVLSRTPAHHDVEVVVQFHDRMGADDLTLLAALGFTIERTFSVIPGAYVIGPKEAIIALSHHPRTYWIEYNEQMVSQLDETTTVINATNVWNTYRLDKLGREQLPITGAGVTAAIVDTGVDAGHPDLDYGSKVIANMKSDFDNTFTDVEDGDTGSGHGTHVAGTIGGNGDASGGARSGVAPGATLVAVSTGEQFLQNVIGALEWVYERSMPGNDPWNIRVCSNSWGSGAGEYDPQDAVTLVAQRLTFENNVVVVFAAGNSGGDGSDIQTSTYGNTPSIIEVAAALHDGTGLATFSSRGQEGLNQTYPDIAAPGYHIWATQARKTTISAERQQNSTDRADAYYMSISGTSMATPHVSGLVALLFEAAPSLRISEIHEDSIIEDPTYWNDSLTRVHEAEYIMEVTADYLNGTGIPESHDNSSNHFGQPYDFAQGHGLYNAQRAVALAMTLEELRQEDPATNVSIAWEYYQRLPETTNITRPTDRLTTQWHGEWGRLNDANSALTSTIAKRLYVPNGTSALSFDFTYAPSRSDGWSTTSLAFQIDTNGDGSAEWTSDSSFTNHGSRHYELSPETVGATDAVWEFSITGQSVGVPPWRNIVYWTQHQYSEVLVEYDLGVVATIEGNGSLQLPAQDPHAAVAKWDFMEPSTPETNSTITLQRDYYNLSIATFVTPPVSRAPPPHGLPWWLLWVAGALVGVAVVLLLRKMRRPKLAPLAFRGGLKRLLTRRVVETVAGK